ncbi:MAG: threonylcarbamoyl-AMP synthase [Planctomycetota bacterium]|nr:MAG: threonylcarbamoyl-AMP synthase [Planctomycetota bacterium]
MARTLPDLLRIEWPAESPAPPAQTERALDRAAEVLRRGGLVAIPTETVYGLAADALDEDAVAGIFRAKGRPASNPLIVHVSDVAMAQALAGAWPPAAEAIASAFWPGPVTVVVPRGPRIPDVVTAGGATVALRCPEHRLTRRLIDKVGRPLAAPSANRSEAVSATTAHHVLAGLGSRVELILDGGSCGRGIESTVVDCTVDPPQILRPGPVGAAELQATLGRPIAAGGAAVGADGPARSPGTRSRHYAPRTPLEMPIDPPGRVASLLAAGGRVGWMTVHAADPQVRSLAASRDLVIVPMPCQPEEFARVLYATLHALDQRGLERIVADPPPEGEAWRAVRDRLTRAAAAGDAPA